ncbi:M56 family metallopeptidase [Fimbriimonas ginsengisoli]|uniref:Antirepressor regulating drug resistance protein n=1 Tax=Fimbriimonas ginsengisoli Gsoil 348 TaxID=661478 RepID=A0A068NTQ7_FIMGI|nr:M56 family metallopeptidase [Fimbriimonas ginsengisoli]AIE86928.1 antirepressor regulating drug resistance protein [Fimbriimonas ginsengisoli Gsoil 348]
MTRDLFVALVLQSSLLFLMVWAIFQLAPAIPANAKAWIWRLAFLKPIVSLLPFAAITLHLLPAGIPEVILAKAPVVESMPLISGPPIPITQKAENLTFDPLSLLWLLGAAGMLGAGIVGRLRAGHIVLHARPVTDAYLLDLLQEFGGASGTADQLALVCSRSIQSPMVVGGRKATIVLPASTLESGSPSDAKLMLLHELAHVRRRDLSWLGLIWLVQSLFFFNPIVWLAARCARQDHESATDRHTAQWSGVPIQTYADMLLRASVVARPSLVPGALPMSESYRTIRRRLNAMKHFDSKPSLARKSAIGALALVTLCALPMYNLAEASSPQQGPPLEVRGRVEAGDAGRPDVISAEFQSYDARTALQMLCEYSHKSYSIDPVLKGTVTVDLRNVTFETALQMLLRQIDGTFRNKKGVYVMTYQGPSVTAPPFSGPTFSGHVAPSKPVTFKCDRMDLRAALRMLFQLRPTNYTIDPAVQGVVTVSVREVTLDVALTTLLKNSNATYRLDKGVYLVVPRSTPKKK